MPFDPQKFKPEGDSGSRESKPYTGTVIDAWFEEGQYGVQLVLQNRLDEADQMEYHWMASGEDKRWFGAGKIAVAKTGPREPWQVIGDGAAVKGDKEDRMFRGDSDLGRLLNQLFSLPNVSDLPEDFDPRVAASWKGLHIGWGPVPVVKRTQVDGDWKDMTVNMDLPVSLGAGATAESTPDVDLDALGLSAEQVTALSKLAQPGTSDSEFVGQAVVVIAGNAAATKVLTSNPTGFRQALPF